MKRHHYILLTVVVLLTLALILLIPRAPSHLAPAVVPSPTPVTAAVPAIPAPQAIPDMVSHKALYQLATTYIPTGSDVRSLKGTMYFAQESVCGGWTSDRRFSTEYNYATFPGPYLALSRYLSFESADGKKFNFSSERAENGEERERFHGVLEQNAEGHLRAIYAAPADLTYDLPDGFYLPIAHTAELVRRARAGEKLFNAIVFEGADDDGPAEINAFIGDKVSSKDIAAIASKNKNIDASLLAPEAWHIRLAVFPLEEEKESLPSYEVDMILHANGIVSTAEVSYPEMQVQQELLALEKLAGDPCL